MLMMKPRTSKLGGATEVTWLLPVKPTNEFEPGGTASCYLDST